MSAEQLPPGNPEESPAGDQYQSRRTEEQAHIEKLQAETELLHAQLAKLQRENPMAERAAKSLAARYWFLPCATHVFQSIRAGLVLAGAFFFLYQPVIETVRQDTEKTGKLAALEGGIQAKKNVQLKQKLKETEEGLAEREQRLETQVARYARELRKLVEDAKNNKEEKDKAIKLAGELRQQLKDLSAEYNAFTGASRQEMEKYRRLAARADERAEQLTAQLETLKAQAKDAKQLAARMQEQVETRPGRVFRDTLKDSSKGPEMIVIPAGSYMMGSPETEEGRYYFEGPRHKVTISRPLAISKYELTVGEYDVFARASGRSLPSDENWGRGNRPVINVSWEDATAYAKWLSEQTGKQYRLPTEAEWEYACRAGSTTAYSFGDDHTQLDMYAWYRANSRNQTHPVGQLKPTAWGLYDMHGNVFEWVQDWFDEEYYQHSPEADPQGPSSGSLRVVRGGSFLSHQRDARCAHRNANFPNLRRWDYGFRVVLLP